MHIDHGVASASSQKRRVHIEMWAAGWAPSLSRPRSLYVAE